MRNSKWELQVLVDGEPLPEHNISDGDGEHCCVESQPGAQFTVKAIYHGTGMHQVELLLDDKSVCGRRMIDTTGTTSLGQHREIPFQGWEKRSDGQKIVSDLIFEQTTTAEEGGGDENTGSGLASAPSDWTRGFVSLRVYGGQLQILTSDAGVANHQPDMSRAKGLSETSMVKGGHTSTAGAGRKSFSQSHVWRAGTRLVGQAPGDPLEEEIRVYYRDSFFLLLRGDESKVKDVPQASNDGQYSDGVATVRANVRRLVETQRQFSHKRPKSDGPVVINLIDD